MNVHVLDAKGLITNTIVVDAGYTLKTNEIDASIGGGCGWTYVGGVLTAPMVINPVPVVISRFQAKAALFNAGFLAKFEALMIAPTTDPIARLAWVESTEFHRQSPTVLAMTVAAGLTSTQVDDLFRSAVLIKV